MATPTDSPNPYGKRASATVTARLSHAQREQVLLCAAAHNVTPGELARIALTRIAAGKDPADVASDLRAALGLDEKATPDEIAAAVSDVIDELLALEGQPPADAAPADPLQGAPDALNPGQVATLTRAGRPATLEGWAMLVSGKAPSTLTAQQAAACKRRGVPATAAGWAQLCKSSARVAGKAPARVAAPTTPKGDVAKLTKASLDAARKAGLTPQEMADRMASAVRRASK